MDKSKFIEMQKADLKSMLHECTDAQRLMFNRMYSHNNLSATVEEAVEGMDVTKIDWATKQVERTLEKNDRENIS